MASAAQIAGTTMVAKLLPAGASMPKITIASRKTPVGQGIAFTLSTPEWYYASGEYRATVIVPNAPGPLHDAARARLAQLLERHAQIERAAALYEEERAACDLSPDGDYMVDDDMPLPGWRINTPLALRRALDVAGVTEAMRLDLAERQTSIDWNGVSISIDDYEDDDIAGKRYIAPESPRLMQVSRTIRRATIASPKAIWSQGITRCYLKVFTPFPESVLAALVGRSPAQIIDLPGMDAPGLCILSSVNHKNESHFEITRAHSMLSALPGETQ